MTDTMMRINDAPAHRRMLPVPELTELQERILRFEEEFPEAGGSKHARMMHEFGMSARQYRRELLRAIEAPAAMDRFPLVVRRCLREVDLGAEETLWPRAQGR